MNQCRGQESAMESFSSADNKNLFLSNEESFKDKVEKPIII